MEDRESMGLKTQVTNGIMRYIRSMDLEKDNKLPREEAFCKLLGTSRVTLRAALDILEAQGVIFRRHGKGTFVNVRSLDIKVSFNPVMDFYDMIVFSGYEPSVRLIKEERISSPGWLLKPMGLRAGAEVLHIQKIFFADKKFCAYTEDYLNIGCLPDPERLREISFAFPVFSLLDRAFGIRVEWDKVEIGVARREEIPAPAARDADTPLLLLKGMNYDSADRPVVYTQEYIDTDLIKFSQIRKRDMTLAISQL